MTIWARDIPDETHDPSKWHVRIHSALPGHMVGRNFDTLLQALECVGANPGARLLRYVEADYWMRLEIAGSYWLGEVETGFQDGAGI